MNPVTPSQIDIPRLISAATETIKSIRQTNAKIPARIFGSAALAIKCPKNIYLWHKTNRNQIRDIDIVTTPRNRPYIRKALKEARFIEAPDNDATNAQQGRLYFRRDDINPFWVEVHSAPLVFHHKIYLEPSLSTDPVTLSLADLAISKLQWKDLSDNCLQETVAELRQERKILQQQKDAAGVFRINQKLKAFSENTCQLIDLCILLAEYSVISDKESEGISVNRILSLARGDWELWATLIRNIQSLEEFALKMFPEESYTEVRRSILSGISNLRSKTTILSDTTIKWRVQSMMHRLIPARFYPIGIEVEEPLNDIWNVVQEGEKSYDCIYR